MVLDLPLRALVNSSFRICRSDAGVLAATEPHWNTEMKHMNRRTFIFSAATAAATPTFTFGQTSNSKRIETGMLVKADQDRFNSRQTVLSGFQIDFKVATKDTDGGLFIIENLNKKKVAPRVTSTMSKKSGFTPSKESTFYRLVTSNSIWVQGIPYLLRERYPMPGHSKERTTEDS